MRKVGVAPLLLLLLLTLCPTVTSFLFWSSSPQDDTEKRDDAMLDKTLKELNKVQMTQQASREHQQATNTAFVQHHYPWLVRNNSMANYFTHRSQGQSKRLQDYHTSAVVFVRHQRSGGTDIDACLQEISVLHKAAMAQPFTADTRIKWTEATQAKGNIGFRNKIKLHSGAYAFGVCDDITKPCAYFTMLRDPMERCVSSYFYCKEALGDELCSAVNANNLSLREWILYHGDSLFRQLLFQPQSCQGSFNHKDYDINAQKDIINQQHIPCWFRQRLKLQQIPNTDRDKLVDYVLDNLEKWFAVVGILEHHEDSIDMYEHVFKLPFSKCDSLKKSKLTQQNEMNNNANRASIISNHASLRVKRRQFDEYDDPEYLQLYDYEVQRALEADYKIYNKAKTLFHIQRQSLKNNLR